MRKIGFSFLIGLAAVAAFAGSDDEAARTIIGHWKADVRATIETLQASPDYQKSDPKARAQVEGAIAMQLSAVTLDITADTIEGLGTKSKYHVVEVKGNRVTIKTEDGSDASHGTFEIVDANTIRLQPPPNIPMLLVLRRGTAPAEPEMHPPEAAQEAAWLKHVAGKWRIDRVTPMAEAERRSEAYKRATAAQRDEAERFWKALSEGPIDYYVFDNDTIAPASDGPLKHTTQPFQYKLVSLKGNVAVLEVSVDDETFYWTLTERGDGSIRQSADGSDNFDLYRAK